MPRGWLQECESSAFFRHGAAARIQPKSPSTAAHNPLSESGPRTPGRPALGFGERARTARPLGGLETPESSAVVLGGQNWSLDVRDGVPDCDGDVVALRPICLLSNEFFPHRGGIAIYSEEVARAAADLGCYVEVWGPDREEAVSRSWPFRFRPIRFAGTQGMTCQLKLAMNLIDQRRHLRRSIVHLADPGAMLSMTYLHHFKAFRPAEIVLTFHGSEIIRFGENPALRKLIAPLVRRATRITTVSNYSRGLLERHFPDSIGRVLVTPLSARRGVLSGANGPKRPAGKIVILTVARIHPRKGQIHVIQALSKLPAALQNQIEYWIVGRGTKEGYDNKLRAEAANCRFPVRFFPDVSDQDLGAYYQESDIFALTSVEHRSSIEGFGIVYLEASMHGLPIIAHATGGVPEAVQHERTGLLTPLRDTRALTDAFARLLESPALRSRLGTAGIAWARSHSWHAVARAVYGMDPRTDVRSERLPTSRSYQTTAF